MDRKALDASSSSQNDNLVFGRIEKAKGRGVSGSGFTVAAEDDSSFFVPASLGQQLQLYPGQELDKTEYDEIKRRTGLLQVRVKALDLLAMRDHSAAELRLKLLQREFPEQYIDAVLTSLEGAGLLDDRRFAESWIRMRLRKNPCGRALLASGLAMKGVDLETAHRAIDAQLNEETLQQALDAAADKLLRRKGMTREKLMRSLMRKGFRCSDVSDAAAARLQASPEHGQEAFSEAYNPDDF
jgi:regulatory protein